MRGRILAVEDDRAMRDLLADGLGRRGFRFDGCASVGDALARIAAEDFDVVVADLNLGHGANGLDLCAQVNADRPDMPVVVITAFGSMETAIAAIRAGAYDFITKPLDLDATAMALDRAVEHRRLRVEVRQLRRAASVAGSFEDMVGDSPAMRRVYDLVDRVAETDATVLVTGESGTGKELIARAVHRRSRRNSAPFVAVSLAAVPDALLESELFGHVRGAFTDARQARSGLLVQAQGGTLFLDEIGDMPLLLQPKLLRALQERSVRPVGGDQEMPFDVRVVAATHHDLETAVAEGRFREDLFYRIHVVPIELPPLRARGRDVLLLAQRFVDMHVARSGKRVEGLSHAAAKRLLEYAWPGNVRELANCIERAVALTRYDEIAVEDLPERIATWKPSHVVVAGQDPSELVPMDEVERRYVLKVLEAAGGNKVLAARILGFDRKTLYRKLDRYGLGPSGARSETPQSPDSDDPLIRG